MAASFILLLLPILRRRRRNKPDSLVSRRPLQKRVVRVNASVVLVQGRWALESDLALEFFYVRFAQLVVLSCTQREEREKSLASGRARGSTKRIQICREKDFNIIFIRKCIKPSDFFTSFIWFWITKTGHYYSHSWFSIPFNLKKFLLSLLNSFAAAFDVIKFSDKSKSLIIFK